MLEYSRWYKHFGLKVRQDDQSNELPDHLVCQLEFLAWLANLESANTDKPTLESGYQRAQQDFIQRHLQPFLAIVIPALAREVERQETATFFAELTNLVGDVADRTCHEFNSVLGLAVKTIDPAQASTTSAAKTVDLWS